MKGFILRDLYHLSLNMKFYLLFIAVMGVLSVISDFSTSFLFFYIMIFCASALMGLFGYDEVNRWQAYATTAPNGRKAQVDGRYAVALLVAVAGIAFLLVLTLLDQGLGSWTIALLYGGMILVYVDVMFPLGYRFGTRNRLIMIILLAVVAGVIGLGGGMIVISDAPGSSGSTAGLSTVSIPLMGIGLVGMVVSRQISVAIMKRKEL